MGFEELSLKALETKVDFFKPRMNLLLRLGLMKGVVL